MKETKLTSLVLGRGTWSLVSNVLMVPREEGAMTIMLQVGANTWSVVLDGTPGLPLAAGCHAVATVAITTPAELRGVRLLRLPGGLPPGDPDEDAES